MRLALFLGFCALFALFCTESPDEPPVAPNSGRETDDGGGDGDGNGDDGGDDGADRPLFLGGPPVLLNEVCSRDAGYADGFGGNPGWVELYNPADTAVDLNGYYLTNSLNRKLWRFGDVVVAPRGYLTVFLSGRNVPDLLPPGDSIDLIGSAVGAWTWADSQNTPVAGRSTAHHTFTGVSIGGSLRLADNTVGANPLGWSSAEVVLKLAYWGDTAVIDMSAANQILFRGDLGKNSKLEIRLVQTGTEGWQSWPAVIAGTGVEGDLYSIELPAGGDFPDLRNINAIRFSNTANFLGALDFSFSSIVARRRGSDAHASFELSKGGGKIFLMDSSWNIRDSVAYPAEVAGLSYARNFESGAWALSKPPTPNAANSTEYYAEGQVRPPAASSLPASGYFADALTFTLPQPGDGVTLCCDTSGRLPTKGSALRSGVTLTLAKTAVMRCAQFKDGAYPSDAVMRTYIIGERRPNLPVVSIAVDPYSMFDSTDGLYATGPNASPADPHYGANYWRDDELPVYIDFFESGASHAWNSGAGLRIFGNWSRANAKKSVVITFREEYGQKNLRYGLFPEHPNLTKFKHFILRNNGNNFPQDYIRDMLMTSLTEGLGIDYQKGRAAIVYYNGKYFGIHNLRERSNGDYFETNYNIDEDFIDLVKVGGEVSRGSDADYQDIVRWLESVALDDENMKVLERRIDVGDFTNNFQCRIYYNDRDWPGNNMKRWRVNSPPSKWKWFMYDTDHGFGSYGIYNQPSIGMLTLATAPNGPDWPNPPHSTFMLRKLLENEGYKNAFINRFSLLIATYFAPARVGARIDALMGAIASEVPLDQTRWKHDAAAMSSQFSVIRNFGSTRGAQMRSEIETFFRLGGAVDVTLSAGGGGSVSVHGLQVLNGRAAFKAYPTVPIVIKAVPDAGMRFDVWSDGVTQAERTITVTEPATLEAKFAAASF